MFQPRGFLNSGKKKSYFFTSLFKAELSSCVCGMSVCVCGRSGPKCFPRGWEPPHQLDYAESHDWEQSNIHRVSLSERSVSKIPHGPSVCVCHSSPPARQKECTLGEDWRTVETERKHGRTPNEPFGPKESFESHTTDTTKRASQRTDLNRRPFAY